MSDPDTQLFRLLDPEGKEIMNGPMSIIMEHLPDTTARNAALEEAVHAAVEAAEAEERANEARASMAQILSDGVTRLSTRLDSYIEQLEEQHKVAAEEAEREEREQIQRKLDQLPDPDEPTAPEPDEPYSLDRRERMATDQNPNEILPPPRDPEEPGPEPGSILYPPRPQIAAPTAISLNSAE
jgi:hypothetical protein